MQALSSIVCLGSLLEPLATQRTFLIGSIFCNYQGATSQLITAGSLLEQLSAF